MIAAATAAMVGGAFAAACSTCGTDATAYTVSASLKTTTPKASVKSSKCNPDTCTYYKVQKTVKYAGIIWGEADCEACTLAIGDQMLLWNTTGKTQVDADLALFIGRYEKKGNKVESYGTLAGDDFGNITLAGFGSMSLKQGTECAECDCVGYVKNISGNAAGFLKFDFESTCGVEECEFIGYDCDCGDPLEESAASGTWKIAYNSDTAKKLAKMAEQDITAAYKIPSYVDADETNEVIIEE